MEAETCEYAFAQEAMHGIQEASAKLALFQQGDRVSTAELQRLVGELKANMAVIDVKLERGDCHYQLVTCTTGPPVGWAHENN